MPGATESDINYLIIQQLPLRAREVLATIDYSETNKISQALARMDLAWKDQDHGSSQSGQNNMGNRYNTQSENTSARYQAKPVRQMERSNSYRDDRNSRPQGREAAGTRGGIDDNWRQRPQERGETEAGGESFQQEKNDTSRNHRENRAEMRSLIKSHNSEFAEELCWDVIPVENQASDELQTRIVSPRVNIRIFDCEYPALLDSGSEVTCVSETLVNELVNKGKLVKLPVSNLSLCVAVGGKATTIKQQVQIACKIEEKSSEFPFLIVPGLATDILIGMDWLDAFGCIIDLENKRINLQGEYLPKGLVSFSASRESKALCGMIKRDNARGSPSMVLSLHGIEGSRENGFARSEASLEERKILYHLGEVTKKVDGSTKSLGDASHETSIPGSKDNRAVAQQSKGNNENFDSEVERYVQELVQLDAYQRATVGKLLRKYEKLFSPEPGCTTIYKHPIIPINEKVVVRRSYPIPLSQRAAVDAEIKRMLDLGVIERAQSPYCNPLRIVQKKNGEVRVCLDARFLNAIILFDNECPPRIEKLLQKFEGARFLSTTDLVQGYWQVPLTGVAKKYTAFLHGSALYQFTRISFGIKTAGAGFIRALDLAIGRELSEVIACYIDDILIVSKTFDEHIEYLNCLFHRLQRYGFTLSLRKSEFFRERVAFLGFILSAQGVEVDPEKLNLYRRFSVRQANFVEPFRELLQGGVAWMWNEGHSRAFVALKKNFTRCVTLSHYLPNAPFRLQTDASDIGLGGVLYQIDDQDDPRIISLASRVLTKCEFRYTTSEKELLAIIYSLIKFRIYLIGPKFHIITDHKALTYFLSTPYHNARMMRWVLYLQEFDFSIEHCKGSDNVVADFLSRNFEEESLFSTENSFLVYQVVRTLRDSTVRKSSLDIRSIANLTMGGGLLRELRSLGALQEADETIRALREKPSPAVLYHVEAGITYVKSVREDLWKLFVPVTLILTLLKSTHEMLGHAGNFKLHAYITRFFYWKNLR